MLLSVYDTFAAAAVAALQQNDDDDDDDGNDVDDDDVVASFYFEKVAQQVDDLYICTYYFVVLLLCSSYNNSHSRAQFYTREFCLVFFSKDARSLLASLIASTRQRAVEVMPGACDAWCLLYLHYI